MAIITKRIRFIVFFLLFIIISPIVVLYAKGDIFTDGWNILQTGGIYVAKAPIGSDIYMNNKLRNTTSFFNRDILIKNLRPGTYDILVKKDSYNSWTEKIKVSDNIVTDANVFILPSKVVLEEIPKYMITQKGTGSSSVSVKNKNQEYTDIAVVFASTTPVIPKKFLATTTIDFKNNFGIKASPIMSGKIGIWHEGNILNAAWFGRSDSAPKYFCDISDCIKTISVYDTEATIRRINFLPGYDGVVIASFGDKIIAIQIEKNVNKKPQLIYQGTAPDFRIIDGELYVKDKDYIGHVIL